MFSHEDLARMQAQSLRMQGVIRKQTYSPEMEKTLRRFSSWEVGERIFKVNQSTLRGRLASDPSLPQGLVEEDVSPLSWASSEQICSPPPSNLTVPSKEASQVAAVVPSVAPPEITKDPTDRPPAFS